MKLFKLSIFVVVIISIVFIGEWYKTNKQKPEMDSTHLKHELDKRFDIIEYRLLGGHLTVLFKDGFQPIIDGWADLALCATMTRHGYSKHSVTVLQPNRIVLDGVDYKPTIENSRTVETVYCD